MFIYCTYRDPTNKAQTCKNVIRRGMHVPICIAHRRARADADQSPAPSRPESKTEEHSPDPPPDEDMDEED